MFGETKTFSSRLLEARRARFHEMAYAVDEEKFLELEFVALRNEIEQTLARRFRILATGVFGIPAAAFAITELDGFGFLFFLPFLVTVLVMIYVAECNALMRCGRYIREQIEPRVTGNVGWETWLESESSKERSLRRTSDRLMKYAFFILSIVYFFVSIVLFYETDITYLTEVFGGYGWVKLALSCLASMGLAFSVGQLIVYVTSGVFAALFFVTIGVMMLGTPSTTTLSASVKPKAAKPEKRGSKRVTEGA